jgi:gamma-glutamyltranspeptidase/glutathione hydrolase
VTGDLFVQTDLAHTLQYMVDCEAAVSGKGRRAGLEAARDAFYCGDIARTIIRYHEEHGGLLTMADLGSFRVTPEPPVQMEWRGASVYTCGPWCQGPTLLQILAILDGFDLKGYGHNSSDYIHVVTEAIKLAFSDRHHFYGDPKFVDVPIKELISPTFAEQRRDLVSMTTAAPGMPPPGTIPGSVFMDTSPGTSRSVRRPSLDTSYVAVIDSAGNAFSATPSDVSFDTPVIPGTGLCPSSRGSQSWGNPEWPAGAGPGRRPRLTPNPAIARRADGTLVAFGTPGGDVQVQAMLQVWLNVTEFGMDLQAAVESPRVASYSFPDSFEPHAYSPGQLNIESRVDGSVLKDLAARGHVISEWPDWTWRAGSVCMVQRGGQTGNYEAAADPRRPCYALAF